VVERWLNDLGWVKNQQLIATHSTRWNFDLALARKSAQFTIDGVPDPEQERHVVRDLKICWDGWRLLNPVNDQRLCLRRPLSEFQVPATEQAVCFAERAAFGLEQGRFANRDPLAEHDCH
jgi:hypothetical protein